MATLLCCCNVVVVDVVLVLVVVVAVAIVLVVAISAFAALYPCKVFLFYKFAKVAPGETPPDYRRIISKCEVFVTKSLR